MGIDNGGTLCKAVLFDESGTEIAGASRRLRMISPRAGHTERDMDELWRENAAAIREAIEKAKVRPEDIKGVACAGHGKGLYLWGKDGAPCRNGIVSTDGRAWEYAEKWAADGTADRVFEKTCQRVLACQPVALLAWLKDHESQVIPRIRWIFEVKDFIRFKLTGEAYAEITDYSGSNMLNLREGRFDKALLAEFGLDDLYGALPPLRCSVDLCGRVDAAASRETGLAEGTPVAGGMFDIDACAIAMDITSDENIAVIAGTWSINEYISRELVLDKSVMMNSLYCMDGYYLIEESSPTSAGNHSWFADLFLGEEKAAAAAEGVSLYRHCDELAASVAPESHDIVFLPYLFGSNYDPRAKASLIGFDGRYTRAHAARAVMEGIAFCHKVHLEKLLANRSGTRAVRLAGGAAASPLWAQIFADVFQLPVETIVAKELGALGCAMAAAVASGTFPDLPAAAARMVKLGARYEPNRALKDTYARKYELYLKVSDALSGTWKDFTA